MSSTTPELEAKVESLSIADPKEFVIVILHQVQDWDAVHVIPRKDFTEEMATMYNTLPRGNKNEQKHHYRRFLALLRKFCVEFDGVDFQFATRYPGCTIYDVYHLSYE
jgi:hypothetical protein